MEDMDIDFYCRKCRKSMKMSYTTTGDEKALVMNGVLFRCHTHKCIRAVMLKNYTEGKIIMRTDSYGRCYL